MDDARYRAFETTADFRRWCDENLPEFIGYRLANAEPTCEPEPKHVGLTLEYQTPSPTYQQQLPPDISYAKSY